MHKLRIPIQSIHIYRIGGPVKSYALMGLFGIYNSGLYKHI